MSASAAPVLGMEADPTVAKEQPPLSYAVGDAVIIVAGDSEGDSGHVVFAHSDKVVVRVSSGQCVAVTSGVLARQTAEG